MNGAKVVLAEAAAVATIVQVVAQVGAQLNGSRSVVIEINNSTESTFVRVADSHEHGGFAVTPSSQIPANKADIFGAQSDSFSVGTGTEGSVVYRVGDAAELTISWVNPFIGGNESSAAVSGQFRVVTTTGSGNTAAHMRYELFRPRAEWLHGIPGESQMKVAPGTSPTSWYTTPENVQHIAYVGATDQQIHECFYRIGVDNRWFHSIPSMGEMKVAPGTSPTSWYTTPENVQHIAYVGTDQKIHQCFFFIGGFGGWQHEVPSDGEVKVAPGTSPTSWYTTPEKVQHIAYVGTDQKIHECFFFVRTGDQTWHHSTPSDGQMKVAPGTSPTSWFTTPETVQHIAYIGATDQQIRESFFFIFIG
jgi:hypothetical protein